jgi:hypothetical protein
MANSNNKQSNGLFSNALGVAKKFSSTSLDLIQHVAPESVSKVTAAFHVNDAIEGAAQVKSPFDAKKYHDPQQMWREHLPNVSRQLLGRHFNTANNVAHFVSPQFGEKVADYFFEHLNDFTNQLSSVDAVLDEAGVRDLEALTQDVEHSKRLSQALTEQNKWFASLQGAFSGATGVIGSAIDIPASMFIALRTIYQVGRSYGFELNHENAQEIVQFVFKQVDLSLVAEKQALLLALKALSNTLKTHDVGQLQALLGSSNDFESLKHWLKGADGQLKWQWMNKLPQSSILSKLSKFSPLAGAGIGAHYSWRFVDDVSAKAQHVFATARQYLIQHENSSLSAIEAYEKGMELLAKAAPQLKASITANTQDQTLHVDQNFQITDNQNIKAVKVVAKTEQLESLQPQADEALDQTYAANEQQLSVTKDEKISQGIEALAEQNISQQNVQKTNTAEVEFKPRVKRVSKKDNTSDTSQDDSAK